MDVLAALDILRTAPDEVLRSHAAQTILTLRKVGERLQSNLFPGTPGVGDPAVNTPPSFTGSVSDKSPSQGNSTAVSLSPGYNSVATTPLSLEGPIYEPPLPPADTVTDVSSAPNDGFASTTILPSPTTRVHGRRPKRPNTVIAGLVQGVIRTSPWLSATSKDGDSCIVSRKRALGEDRRLEDIRRVEGDPQISNEAKLLRVLAIRSLAFEFNEKQTADGISPTRLDELCHYALSPEMETDISQKGQHGAVSAFVKSDARFTSGVLARRAIHNGVKRLVFERVLANRLQQLDMPNVCEAISAILGLNINQFRCLRYDQMSSLVEELLSENMQINMERDETRGTETKQHLLDVLRDLTPWFEQLQLAYNVPVSQSSTPELDVRIAKRARPNTHTTGESHIDSFALHVDPPEVLMTLIEESHPMTGSNSDCTDRGGVETISEPSQQTALEFAQPVDAFNMGTSSRAMNNVHVLPDQRSLFEFEQDLFDQISTQPHDCTTLVQDAFESSLNFNNLVVQQAFTMRSDLGTIEDDR